MQVHNFNVIYVTRDGTFRRKFFKNFYSEGFQNHLLNCKWYYESVGYWPIKM